MKRGRLALVALALAACDDVVGAVTFDGPGTRDLAVTATKPGAMKLEADLEIVLPRATTPIASLYTLSVETVRGGTVTGKTTCDPLALAWSLDDSMVCSTQQHTDCTRRAKARIAGCVVPAPRGASTLHLVLARSDVATTEEIVVKRLAISALR